MNKAFFILIIIFWSQALLAANVPPQPSPSSLPPPVGLPIDAPVIVVLFLVVITGYHLSQKYTLNKKDSL